MAPNILNFLHLTPNLTNLLKLIIRFNFVMAGDKHVANLLMVC